VSDFHFSHCAPAFRRMCVFRLQKMRFVGNACAQLEKWKLDMENCSRIKKVPFWYVRFPVSCAGKAGEKNGYGLLTENRWYAASWRRGRSTPKKFSHLFRKFRSTFPTVFPKIFRDRRSVGNEVSKIFHGVTPMPRHHFFQNHKKKISKV